MCMDEDALIDLSVCREAAEGCAAQRLHRAARAVNRFYDRVREPAGLTGAQFSLLVTLALAGEPAVGDLAERLELDQTTLSRTLRPLRQAGLLTVQPGADRRVRHVRLTLAGRARLDQALRLWRQAQRQFLDALGPQTGQALADSLRAARRAVRDPGS